MNTHQNSRRLRASVVVIIAVALPIIAAGIELEAGPKKARPTTVEPQIKKSDQAGQVANEDAVSWKIATPVRLNHMRSPWSKVLKDYAEATNKVLVADVVPGGTFTRWDLKSHEAGDALRILNRELEPLGFRLLEKQEHLVLIELKKTRREYQPAVIPNEKSETAVDDESDVGDGAEVVQVAAQRKAKPAGAAGRSARPAPNDVEPAPRRMRKPGRIEQVSAEEEETSANIPVADEELKLTTVRLKARDAVAVSRIMYNAFKDRAELVDDGPKGLQGFRVRRIELDANGEPRPAAAGAKARFTVGIDENRNQLVIEATAQETPSILRLIKTLDVLPREGEGTVRAVSTKKDAGVIASALQPEIDRLAAASRKASRKAQLAQADRKNRGDDDNDEDALANAQEEEAPANPPAARRRAASKEEEGTDQPVTAQSLIKSLKGDVEIQSIPDLGIMVIIGNEQDAETVISVIREIERLSAGAVPSVELVFLRHINSEALASLLTSVYDRLSPARGRTAQPGGQQQQQQNVLVIPIARPNAVLIVASRVDIDSAKDLAEQLDQPSDPQMEYKVFRLKYAIPSKVVETIGAIYGSGTQGQGQQQQSTSTSKGALAPQVKITDDPRTNSVIVQARPRDLREVALLIRDLDTADSAAVSEIRIFTLKAAVADELSATLNQAIQSLLSPARIPTTPGAGGNQGGGAGGTQGNAELREVKSMILQYLDEEDGPERVLQSGILADIRIIADLRTNSIVVTAPERSMELVAKLIKRFDKPNASVAELKVFHMDKGDAQATVTLLNALFSANPQGQRPGQGGPGGQIGQNFPGVQILSADDASSTLIPLKFSVDVRTNSIVAVGGAEALRVVEAVILRLDESEIREREIEVYKLKNTPAAEVALAVGNFLTSRRQVETTDQGLVSPFEQMEREVIVVAEPVSNSLLISATERYFKEIKKLVVDIDKAPKQVLIQALLVEVQLENQDEWGVELGLQDSILFDRSLLDTIQLLNTTFTLPNGNQTTSQTIVSQNGVPGYNFNNQPLGNNTSPSISSSRVGAQGLSNFAVGRINGDLGYGGLVLSAGSSSVSALLRALAARRRVDVLSRPQIRTLDNQLAQIQVGQEIPRVQGFQVNQIGNASPQVQIRPIGIILAVTPRISPDGMVVMEVAARKDALNPQGIPLFVNPDGSTISSPIIDTTNALSTVSVKSGQTIVLGGMITKSNETLERKVPLLGDIPFIGQAFRYDLKRSRRTELLMFLTPRVVEGDAEAEMIKEIETQRMNFIEAEAEMIHGPLFGVPADGKWAEPSAAEPPVLLPPATIPVPPNPGARAPRGLPMLGSDDDPQTPTTVMPVQSSKDVFEVDEDMDIDLSKKKRTTKRDQSIAPARFEQDARAGSEPGRTMLRGDNPSPSAPQKKKRNAKSNSTAAERRSTDQK